ncbi:MAG TPA: acyltransferase domain-containing protein [Acidimicrobiales bacterium]|nr:acyltransferase domain-containing protein [Acidimicrobiales bacterium]
MGAEDWVVVDGNTVAERLGLGPRREAWLQSLDRVAPSATFALPDSDHAADLLALLAIPPEDADAVLSVWPDPERDPEIWWLLERCHARLVTAIGDVDAVVECPPLPRALGLRGRCFWVFAFASMVPVTRELHARRGVPDEVSRATLADLGQQMVIHRRRHDSVGLDLQWWLVPHFLGTLYALGRLQFHLYRLRCSIAGPAFWPDSDEPGFRHGDATLGIHIPAIGALTPESCDASFAAARSFVDEHFPEHDFRVGTCTSWLLDDQLASCLPADSNIVQFQRRFHVVDGAADDSRDTLLFVFDRVPESFDDLPQRTTLERAIVQHLRAGGRWRTRTGWVEL